MTTFKVCHGDQMVVKVENMLMDQGITIHWHGIHQRRTPWYDGVPEVTQCPIMAGNTFTYNFTAETPGTQWYHSHAGVYTLICIK